jgi:hypothetical protein
MMNHDHDGKCIYTYACICVYCIAAVFVFEYLV